MNQLRGFEGHGRDCDVCRLRRTSYRLKWAPDGWHQRIMNIY